jgi:hypothetical protein
MLRQRRAATTSASEVRYSLPLSAVGWLETRAAGEFDFQPNAFAGLPVPCAVHRAKVSEAFGQRDDAKDLRPKNIELSDPFRKRSSCLAESHAHPSQGKLPGTSNRLTLSWLKATLNAFYQNGVTNSKCQNPNVEGNPGSETRLDRRIEKRGDRQNRSPG